VGGLFVASCLIIQEKHRRADNYFMKKIKLPNPIVMVVGGLGAFWIADIINPGFNPIGIMVFMLIPIIIFEMLYPEPELEQILEQVHYRRHEAPEPTSGELLENEEGDESKE